MMEASPKVQLVVLDWVYGRQRAKVLLLEDAGGESGLRLLGPKLGVAQTRELARFPLTPDVARELLEYVEHAHQAPAT